MTSKSIIVYAIFVTISTVVRVAAILAFFAAPLGLFDLLMHWKVGSYDVTNNFVTYDVTGTGSSEKLKDVWKKIDSYEQGPILQNCI